MPVREFPALRFDPAPGDPAALAAAAQTAAATATTLASAADRCGGMGVDGWSGDAATAFRAQAGVLPRDLNHAAQAHHEAASALTEYAQTLTALQSRAASLELDAAAIRARQQSAVAEVNRIAATPAPAGSTTLADLQSGYDAARTAANQYADDLERVLRAARQVAAAHADAAQAAANRIRAVSDAPYKQPSLLHRLKDKVTEWITDHSDTLLSISSALKSVSAVLGLLSMVPGLQFLAPVAMAAAGLALGIDAIVKVTTGKGSWTSIGIDAALTFLPLGKALSLAKRGTVAASHAVGSAVHAGNATPAEFHTLFGALEHVNAPRFHLGWPWKNNCQSCVVAVDRTLAGHPASAIPRPENPFRPGESDPTRPWHWPKDVINAANVGRPKKVQSYEEITARLRMSGDQSRGIVHGYNVKPDGGYGSGHVFNVINKGGVIYYLDGQVGTWARLVPYDRLELLMGR